jgi:cysteine dioxygenase
MDLSLAQWFAELDQYSDRIPLRILTDGLKRLRIELSEIQPFAHFSDERYQRNLMHAGPAYHALILCWRNGQSSPIHDHRGSSCAVRIVAGEATETVFEMTEEGRLFEARRRKLPQGFMCATQDLDIHRLSNLQRDRPNLITLHIYSPPLLTMGQYSLEDSSMSEFKDDVHVFVEGAGI